MRTSYFAKVSTIGLNFKFPAYYRLIFDDSQPNEFLNLRSDIKLILG